MFGCAWKKIDYYILEKKLVKKDEKEYILDGDAEYPREPHNNHNKLPFLAKRMKIKKVEKLVLYHKDKKMYRVDIKSLIQALIHSLEFKKVHRVTRFEQSRWMKPCILLNTRLRITARNEFEKYFFKLMNNSVFEKGIKNIMNHKGLKFVTSRQKYVRYVMNPTFKGGYSFLKDLFAVEME